MTFPVVSIERACSLKKSKSLDQSHTVEQNQLPIVQNFEFRFMLEVPLRSTVQLSYRHILSLPFVAENAIDNISNGTDTDP